MCDLSKDDAMELVRCQTGLNVKTCRVHHALVGSVVDDALVETQLCEAPFYKDGVPLRDNRWYVGRFVVLACNPVAPPLLNMGVSVKGGAAASVSVFSTVYGFGAALAAAPGYESGLMVVRLINTEASDPDDMLLQFIGYEVTTD